MSVKVYDEAHNTIIDAAAQLDCPWKSNIPPDQPPEAIAPHYFPSDAPDDNDTCACGRFFFVAIKNLTGA